MKSASLGMERNIIVPDANVIIAASIVIKNPRKAHKHYYWSDKLLRQLNKNIGFRVQQIVDECSDRALTLHSRFIREWLEREYYYESRHELNEICAKVQRIFMKNKKMFLSKLREIPNLMESDDSDTVCEMVVDLQSQYRDLLRKRTVENKENQQLKKFISGIPHRGDTLILSQVRALKRYYGDDMDVFIASNDSGFFSPIRDRNNRKIISRIVTDEIFSRFNIRCDHPQEIVEVLEMGRTPLE